MNTTKQLLTESPGNIAMHGNLVSRAERKTSVLAPDDTMRKHRQLAVLVFGGIALVAHPLGRALAGLPRQEFEGLGAVVCALAYVGIFLSRVIRALKQDSLQAETSKEEQTATQSEPRRK